jgi:redox-sensitive bicupin YhaK (pirin superfamily)
MSIALLIDPRPRDLGSFSVRRALPDVKRRSVGPFIFFDHLGPAVLAPGQGMDVRPHPHIGLATVTYLFEGALEHRDSLGNVQVIRPGDVNWMTAGRGIVHSERTPAPERAAGIRMHGIQTWLALPLAYEETQPAFHHHPAATLPAFARDGAHYRIIAGHAWDHIAPVHTFAPTLYVAVEAAAGAPIAIPDGHVERALYVAEGRVRIAGTTVEAGQLAVLDAASAIRAEALAQSRVLICGGAPLDGERHLWWNFVSSSRERIERAKADWSAGRFAAVPGETEAIPLPER